MKIINHKANRNQPGAARSAFTLVELLLVLTILAILAGIVLPKHGRAHRAGAHHARPKRRLPPSARRWARYEVDNGFYPKGSNGLQALVQKPRNAQNWHGPYLEEGHRSAGSLGQSLCL